MNETLVENVWKNGQVNATLTGTDAKGQAYKLFVCFESSPTLCLPLICCQLNSSIDNGDQVTATFTLSPVQDEHAAEGTA